MPLYIADFSGTRPTWTVDNSVASDSYQIITFSDGREGSRLDADFHSGASRPVSRRLPREQLELGFRTSFDNVPPGRYIAYCGRRFEVAAGRETPGVGFRVWLFRISPQGLEIEQEWFNRCAHFDGDGTLMWEHQWGSRYEGELWPDTELPPAAQPVRPAVPRYTFEPDRPQE